MITLQYDDNRPIIPNYKDLNIYKLPNYKELDHKDIMTLYVKDSVNDKEIRKELFNALWNCNYLHKFYNDLRK